MNKLLIDKKIVTGLIGIDNEAKDALRINEYFDYKNFCEKHKIIYIGISQYDMKDSEIKAILLSIKIDLLIVSGWQRLIPEWLIRHCTYGAIGLHGSPDGITKGRGRSPQNWALLLGCKKFELSIFWIAKNVDNGKIIDTRTFTYAEYDNINTSYLKVGYYGAEMIYENMKRGNLFKHYGIEQNEKEAAYYPKRIPEDGIIDWNQNAVNIYYLVKALTKPYPGAFTLLNGEKIILWECFPISIDLPQKINYQNGEIVSLLQDNEFVVKCKNSFLYVKDAQADTNIHYQEGDIFESISSREQLKKIIERHKKLEKTKISDRIIKLLEQQEYYDSNN